MRRIARALLVAWAFAPLGGLSAFAAADDRPCQAIVAACEKAGFVKGAVATGKGLEIDCIRPIMEGSAPPPKAALPLPAVDSALVAACKARRDEAAAAAAAKTPTPPLADFGKTAPAAGRAASRGKRPNIVFVLADDLSSNLVPFMPHVQDMQAKGTTFTRYYVADSLLSPSRSSILTGRFPHDAGVVADQGPDGGFSAFAAKGDDKATFATALAALGYRTAMLGEYLNGYEPEKDPPALGWSSWAVAGDGHPEFDYTLNIDHGLARHGHDPSDYLTDVLDALATTFIKNAAAGPFLIEIATVAPHAPYAPAPRDDQAFPDLKAPRGPAFNAAPDASTPKWLAAQPQLSDAEIAQIDLNFRMRAQSAQAVDKLIGDLEAAIAAAGAADRTYFVFSSDMGFHMGEHRLLPGRMTAFDTDIAAPLIVVGPGVSIGAKVDAIAESVDLNPTFVEIAGGAPAASVEGQSLLSLLKGAKPTDWRNAALIEHHGPNIDPTDPDMSQPRSGNPTSYAALRTVSAAYVEYLDGGREYYEVDKDPGELHNVFSDLPSSKQALLHAALTALVNCHDAHSCRAAPAP